MKPVPTLRRFDQFLATRGLRLDAVVVGGSALALLGITARQTRDCDILFPEPHVVFRGDALTLSSLHRMDLRRSKLFALCDRGIDWQDCVALAPTAEELEQIRPWLEERDANPDWPTHVRATLDDLRGTLRHGV